MMGVSLERLRLCEVEGHARVGIGIMDLRNNALGEKPAGWVDRPLLEWVDHGGRTWRLWSCPRCGLAFCEEAF